MINYIRLIAYIILLIIVCVWVGKENLKKGEI